MFQGDAQALANAACSVINTASSKSYLSLVVEASSSAASVELPWYPRTASPGGTTSVAELGMILVPCAAQDVGDQVKQATSRIPLVFRRYSLCSWEGIQVG